jgi:hypothetical protein
MPSPGPSPTTLRLMACLESFSHEEEGAIGHDDWAGLAGVLTRELAALRHLALENPGARAPLAPRAEKLRQRYARLSARVDEAKARGLAELAALGSTAARVNDVRRTYLKT